MLTLVPISVRHHPRLCINQTKQSNHLGAEDATEFLF